MNWDMAPIHKLGRWRILFSPSTAGPVRNRRGAGRGGAKSIPAVHFTAASCQVQLLLRRGIVEVIRTFGGGFTTHGDLSCFISNERLIALGLRDPRGHGLPDAQRRRQPWELLSTRAALPFPWYFSHLPCSNILCHGGHRILSFGTVVLLSSTTW